MGISDRRYPPHELANIISAVRDPDQLGQIGPYQIESLIAEGGMGSVYRAQQLEPIRRTVAIKVIKLGMDTRQVIARFDAERQTLAMMDHPNVATVLDAGATESGRPYFVMEYVDGDPITHFADREKLSLRQRLELFTQACDAVQHAHQKAIIHRDLKPSNILVTLKDEKPIVKVIDFGVAKAITDQTATHTMATEVGQMLGTPEYMAPEQAAGNVLDIDTRTDVYGLGVVLYELLIGVLPFEVSRKAVVQLILETNPPRPSARLSRLADSGAEMARLRRTDLNGLHQQLARELEWIPLKAIRKEREHRYASARELADDIANYLADRPLRAGPESGLYRMRKFVRRNKFGVAALATIMLLLLGGIAATSWQAIRATRAERTAQANAAGESIARARAEAITEFVTKALVSSDPNEGGSQKATVVQAMQNALKEIDAGALKGNPQTEAALKATIASILQGNGMAREAEPLYQDVLAARQRLFSGDHLDVAMSLNDVGAVRVNLGRAAEALPLLKQSLEMRRRLLPGDHGQISLSLNNLALACVQSGQLADAERYAEQALEMARRLHRGDHNDVAIRLSSLARVKYQLGRAAEAEPLNVEALAMRRRLYPGDHPELAASLNNLGSLEIELARYDQAETLLVEAMEMYRRMFQGDHEAVAQSMHNVASVRHQVGRLKEAEPLYLQALQMRQRLYPGDHANVAANMSDLGFVYSSLGRLEDAEPYVRGSLEMYRRFYRGDHLNVASGLNNLASTWQDMGRVAEAEPLFVQALEMRQRIAGAALDNPSVALSLNNLARCRVALGKLDDADRDATASVQMYERLFKDGHPRRAVAISTLAMVRHQQGKADQATALLADAEAMLLKTETLTGLHGRKILQARQLILGAQSAEPSTRPTTEPSSIPTR